MASSKLSDLPSATPASADLLYIVDVSDTTDSPDGSSKKTTVGDVLLLSPVTSVAGRAGAVTLTSADISDSTATGRSLLTAADAAAARAAIGAGVGNALTSGTLAQFAATTSAELAGVLTDETGSGGGFVRATGPTLNGVTLSGTTAAADVNASGTVSSANFLVSADAGRIRNSSANASSGILLVSAGDSYVYGQGGSSVAHFITGRGIGVTSTVCIGFCPGNADAAFADIAFARVDSNTVEINNGTRTASGGALRGLSVSTLTASGQIIGSGGFTGGLELRGGGTSTNRVEVNGFAMFGLSGSTIQSAMNRGASSSFSVLSTGGLVWGTTTSAEGPSASATAGIFRPSAATLEVTNGRPTSGGGALGNLNLALLNLGTYTVATLPSASANAGAFAQVTDSNSTTNGNTVAGGGSNRVPVFSSGTNWIIK